MCCVTTAHSWSVTCYKLLYSDTKFHPRDAVVALISVMALYLQFLSVSNCMVFGMETSFDPSCTVV